MILNVDRYTSAGQRERIAQADGYLKLVTLLLRFLTPRELEDLKLTRIGREQQRMHHPDAVMPTESPKPAKKRVSPEKKK